MRKEVRQPRRKAIHSLVLSIEYFNRPRDRGRTEAGVKFLSGEQGITLQSINGQRDAAQHSSLDILEHQLYFFAQARLSAMPSRCSAKGADPESVHA